MKPVSADLNAEYLPLLFGGGFERLLVAEIVADIVDQHIQPAMGAADLVHDALDCIPVPHIGFEDAVIGTQLGERATSRCGPAAVDLGDHDCHAEPGEELRGGEPDAGAAAGHQRHLAGKAEDREFVRCGHGLVPSEGP